MWFSREYKHYFPLDIMTKEWENSYKEKGERPPRGFYFHDFYNYWYHQFYDQINYELIESMKKFLIWNSSYDEIYSAWCHLLENRE